MKKQLFIASLLVLSTSIVSAQNADTSMTTMPVSHWSIGLKGGTNYFRAAPSPASRLERMHFIWGGTIDYAINPLVGFGIELLNNPYGGEINNTTTLNANTFDVVPYLSVNLSNLLSPYRTGFWKKVSIYGESGMGVGFYNYSLNTDPEVSSKTLLATVGLNAEYSLSKHWSLGLGGQYRYYDRSNLGGADFSKGNCEALTATIGLRFKFGASKKPHARNISMVEFNPKPTPVVDNQAAANYEALKNRVEAAEKANSNTDRQLQDLKNQLNELSKRKPTEQAPTIVTSFEAIEFELNSDQLTNTSFYALDKMAELLKNATWSGLTVYGNTDSTGSTEYNQGLSERRANVVKNYLLSKGVSEAKVNALGNGELKPVATNDTAEGRQKNRRVDFIIGK